MAIRKILQSEITGGTEADDKFLRMKTMRVESMTKEIEQIITDLKDTLWAYPFSVGLSAPQIGYPYAISVINPKRESKENDQVIINPQIISLAGKKDRKRESCMSVWGEMGEVERRDKIAIEYRDETFNLKRDEYKGFEARVVQHELDHLEGVLYPDKLFNNSKLYHANFFDEYAIIKE